MIMVKTVCVAVNPNDYKIAGNFPIKDLAVGCDFAGIIVALGSGVTRETHSLEVGDRICGGIHGSNPLRPHVGAFGEYITAYADCVLKIPEAMPWENAAAIGGAASVTTQILYPRHAADRSFA